MFDLDNLPQEVIWAIAFRMTVKHTGQETMERYRKVVMKYPNYFLSDYGYFMADQETHDKYKEEVLKLEKKYLPKRKPLPDFGNEGIFNYISNLEPPKNLTLKEMSETLDKWQQEDQMRRKFKEKEEKLYNKIYGK